MIYFDNAATSKYKPKCMIKAMVDTLVNSSNPGRSAHHDAIDIASKIYDTRKYILDMLHANSSYEVIFTKNTTEALNMAIIGYISTFRYKVHVITSMQEHNSVLRVLKHLAMQGQIDVTILPIENDSISVADIELHIRNNTRLIVLNHMSNVTGNVIDIATATDIAKAYNIPILVDTAQSLGHIHINLFDTPLSMIAAAGHKGLHGPEGTGFLVINRDMVTLTPLTYGGTGTNSNILNMPIEYPESFEVGTLNAPAIIGLGESIRWTYDNFQTINSHISKLGQILYTYLRHKDNIKLYSPIGSNVLSFNVSGYSSEEIASYLNEKNIATRSGLHCAPLVHSHYGTLECGMVRASLGYNNSIGDIDMLISALDDIPIK